MDDQDIFDSINAEITNPQKAGNSRKRKLSRKWLQPEICDLISSMELRECLWNPYSQLYKNRDLREKNWSEVTAATKHSVADCKMQWNTLKTRYNSESRKTRATVSGQSGQTYVSKWEHYTALEFLLPTRARSPGSSTVSSLNFEDSAEEAFIEEEVVVTPRSTAQSTPTTPTAPKDAVYAQMQAYFKSRTSQDEEQPRNKWKRTFLEYVYEEMCGMPEEEARQLKMVVDQFINNRHCANST